MRVTERETLTTERTALLDYQTQLDEARDAIEGGEISAGDLDALDAAIMDAMPPTVAAHVPGMEREKPDPHVSVGAVTPTKAPIFLPQDMTSPSV